MRRLLALTAVLCALAPPAALAQSDDAALRAALARSMRAAGPASGAYVLNATEERSLFDWRANAARILASNTKLFTTAAALELFGPGGTFETVLLGDGSRAANGRWQGNLVLLGGGDPTFGSSAFVRSAYGSGGEVERLADHVRRAGIRDVTGGVIGDESQFDSLRGSPAYGYRVSPYLSPLSALSFNRGSASRSYPSPPLYAAARLKAELERRGVRVRGAPRAARTPADAEELASVASPPLARLSQITNKRSDNFFAEMLMKGLGLTATNVGSTAAGAQVATGFARDLGVRVQLADGSGLSRRNNAAPRQLGLLLQRMRRRSSFGAFYDSLPIAGREGTLAGRMRSGPAAGRCRAKTGTLAGVSALSGYCRSRGGDTIVFSFLMNGVNTGGARRLQDRMTHAVAAYRG